MARRERERERERERGADYMKSEPMGILVNLDD